MKLKNKKTKNKEEVYEVEINEIEDNIYNYTKSELDSEIVKIDKKIAFVNLQIEDFNKLLTKFSLRKEELEEVKNLINK